MARHVKQGDLVQVITGNDRGKTGRVLRVIPQRDRVIVEGINMRMKHVRPSQQNPQGGRMEREMSIHISNVMPISPSSGKPTRVRFERRTDGSKVRLAVRGGDELSVLRKPAR
jgi:large subunit ribosomal protein L24